MSGALDSGLPVLDELVVTGRGAKARYRAIVQRLDRCGSLTFTSNGKTVHATLGRMSFPAIGAPSAAYSLGTTID